MTRKLDKMNFKKQVTGLKIVRTTKPRLYLQWTNTEIGRDVFDCFERVEDIYVKYINAHNPSSVITQDHTFFIDLEEMYQSALEKERNSNEPQNPELGVSAVIPRILHFIDENDNNVNIHAGGVNVVLKLDGTHEYFRSYGFAGRMNLTPVYSL